MHLFKKILAPLIIFFVFFTTILNAYSLFGPKIDNDSSSYTYFISSKEIDYQRPPAYPILLYLVNISSPFPTTQFFTNLFIIQTVLISLSAVLGFLTLKKIVHHSKVSFFITLLGVFYFPLIRYANNLNPEILLTFFIMLMSYLSVQINAFKSKTHLTLFIIALSLANLTKPIMLYVIFVVLLFFILLFLANLIPKKNFPFLLSITCIIWLLPIIYWSQGNKVGNNIFTYSKIQEMAILGKLISYNMLDLGPDYINDIPIKSLLLSSKSPDIWSRSSLIFDQNIYPFHLLSNAMLSYGRATISKHPFLYLNKSIHAFPKIISNEYITDYQYCVKNSKIPNIWHIPECKTPFQKAYMQASLLIFENVIRPHTIFLLLLSFGQLCIKIIQIVSRKTLKPKHHDVFLYLFLLYFIACICLGAYEQYSRLLAPIRFTMFSVMFVTTLRLFQFIKKQLQQLTSF